MMSLVLEPQQVFHRAVDPLFAMLSPDQMRALAELTMGSAAEDRIQHLAELANGGELSPAEQAEYEAYIDANNFLTVLQAEARLRLTDSGA